MGEESQEAKALQDRIMQEASRRRDNTPKHVLLNNLEKKLRLLGNKIQKNEEKLGHAEEELVEASKRVEEVKAIGRGLHQQQQALEDERAQIGLCL